MREFPAPLSERALLAHIGKLPHAQATFKQLVRELGARGKDRGTLEEALARLAARGDLVEVRNGHFAVTRLSREFAIGRMSMHRDGYGFLVADHPVAGVRGDIFLPAAEAQHVMHGDRVLVRIGRIDGDGRAEGEVLRILRRAHPEVVGEFRVRKRGNFVVPHDERLRHWILIPEGMEKTAQAPSADRIGARPYAVDSPEDLNGLIVNVELLEYPEDNDGPVGRVIEVLGRPDDFGVDVEVIIRKHHLPHQFPREVLQQARRVPQEILPEEIARRRDFRDLDIVTIDGETARDFDDAVWVQPLDNGHYALQVHIADVSHYVRPETAIDREARLRGTSVYFPDRAVPMLPLELSTEICSLKPGVDRLVLSALLEIDRQGGIVRQEFCRGVIRSAQRMTYTEVHALLQGDAELRARYAPLVERFEWMRDLALILYRKRQKRGSIDFDLPEPLIEFNESGEMTGISRTPRNIAHRIIEEFMLAANEAVAAHFEAQALPAIYRIHEPPDPRRVLEFEEVAIRFGYSLGLSAVPVQRHAVVDRKRDGRRIRKDIILPVDSGVTSRNYQRLIAAIEGRPEERIVSYLMLRSLKQARYSEQNAGHFALACRHYTHFTSPIRRYPDLVVHRILSNWLDHARPSCDEEQLQAIAIECSETERRAAEAERELLEWKKIKFMVNRVGERFHGVIISTARYGFFVELEELFIEGLVPIESLPGERFLYQENTRRVVGERTRRQFAIGDRVEVILDRVDGVEKRLQFSVFEEPKRRGKKA